jgi:hypothetical protein
LCLFRFVVLLLDSKWLVDSENMAFKQFGAETAKCFFWWRYFLSHKNILDRCFSANFCFLLMGVVQAKRAEQCTSNSTSGGINFPKKWRSYGITWAIHCDSMSAGHCNSIPTSFLVSQKTKYNRPRGVERR